MKEALSYVAGAIIAAGVVAMLQDYNRQAAMMLAFITILLVIIAKQEAVTALIAGIGKK